jgi:hypothetical protein
MKAIAVQRLNQQKAEDPAQKLRQGSGKSGFHLGNLAKGWGGVAKDLVSPVTNFVQHPGLRTGLEAAAAFPGGATGVIPRKCDARAGGKIEQLHAKRFPGIEEIGLGPELQTSYAWSENPMSNSQMMFTPESSFVQIIRNPEGAPKNLFMDLLAPAINRARTKGLPVAANAANPRVAKTVLQQSARTPGITTPYTIESAHHTLDSLARAAIHPDTLESWLKGTQVSVDQARRTVAWYMNALEQGMIEPASWHNQFPPGH